MMRIEVQITQMSSTIIEGHASIRKDIAATRVSDTSIVAFMGSNSGTLSKLPPEITVDFISDTYLRFQIDAIDCQLGRLSSSTNFYAVEEPLESYLSPFETSGVSRYFTSDRDGLRQDIIAQTLTIQKLLSTDSEELSVQSGAWDMVNLTIGLHSLEMYEEAVKMGSWTVNLFRTLVRTNPDVYTPYLIHSLRHLSKYYIDINDMDGASAAAIECVKLSRGLQAKSPTYELTRQLAGALTTSSSIAEAMGEKERSLTDARESVRILEGVLGIQPIPWDEGDGNLILQQSMGALACHQVNVIYDYSRALHRLSSSLSALEKDKEALAPGIGAMKVTEYIFPIYDDDAIVAELANLYHYLAEPHFRGILPPDESLLYARQSARLYRQLWQQNMKQYGESLCFVLWEEASILGDIQRYEEAFVVWKEIADLAADIMADQLFRADALDQLSTNLRRLKRHAEAAEIRTESAKVYHSIHKTVSVSEADAYFSLSIDLRLANKSSKALEPLEFSISQYRALAYKEEKYVKDVVKGLVQLTHLLINLKDHERAFNEGHEALKICKATIEDDPTILMRYVSALHVNSFLCTAANDEDKAVERSQYTIDLARALVEEYPAERPMITELLLNHAIMMSRFLRLPEGTVATEEAIAWFRQHPVETAKNADLNISCLIQHASLLDKQGFTERALHPMEEAIKIGRPFSSDGKVVSQVLGSMHRRAHLFCELGRYAEGVVVIEDAISFGRENKSDNPGDFIGCLKVASMCYRYSGRTQEAIHVVREAIELCQSEDMSEISISRPLEYLHYPECLQMLSEAMAELGEEQEALVYAEKAWDEAIKLKDRSATLSWPDIEPSYRCVQSNLAFALFVNDQQIPRARQMMVEARCFYEQYSEKERGSFTVLAVILRAEGIIGCAYNHHEEGAAARRKLADLQRRLRITFPSLGEMVEVELKKERNMSSWKKVLQRVKLQCEHQGKDP